MGDYGFRSFVIPHRRAVPPPLPLVVTIDAHAQNIHKINQITEPKRLTVSVIDRLKAKALAAKGIVPDMAKKFEADLDGIIAGGADLETQRNAAVAPHLEAIAGMKGELSDLKSAIDILSND